MLNIVFEGLRSTFHKQSARTRQETMSPEDASQKSNEQIDKKPDPPSVSSVASGNITPDESTTWGYIGMSGDPTTDAPDPKTESKITRQFSEVKLQIGAMTETKDAPETFLITIIEHIEQEIKKGSPGDSVTISAGLRTLAQISPDAFEITANALLSSPEGIPSATISIIQRIKEKRK